MPITKPSQKHWELWGLLESFRHGRRQEAFPSVRLLADRLGCCARTVRRRLADLRAFGMVTTEPRYVEGGRQTSNLFVTQTMQKRLSHASSSVSPDHDRIDERQPIMVQNVVPKSPPTMCPRGGDRVVTATFCETNTNDKARVSPIEELNIKEGDRTISDAPPPDSLLHLLMKHGATMKIRNGSLVTEWEAMLTMCGITTAQEFHVAAKAIASAGGSLAGALPSRMRMHAQAIKDAIQAHHDQARALVEQQRREVAEIKRQHDIAMAKREMTVLGVTGDIVDTVAARVPLNSSVAGITTAVQEEQERMRRRMVIADVHARVGGKGEWRPSAKRTDADIWCLSGMIVRSSHVDANAQVDTVIRKHGLSPAAVTLSERMLISMTGNVPKHVVDEIVGRAMRT